MLSVLQVAQLGAAVYDQASRWDLLLSGSEYAGTTVGVRVDAGNRAVTLAFRGTACREDVLKDIAAVMPQPAGELGAVALGFFSGTAVVFDRVKALLLEHRIICTGHSLGAAQASDFAAYSAYHGLPAHACVLMGSPRPGGADLNWWLSRLPVWHSFRNGEDPVCMVPSWATHDRPQVPLSEPGPPGEGLLGCHHVDLYLRGIAKLSLPEVL